MTSSSSTSHATFCLACSLKWESYLNRVQQMARGIPQSCLPMGAVTPHVHFAVCIHTTGMEMTRGNGYNLLSQQMLHQLWGSLKLRLNCQPEKWHQHEPMSQSPQSGTAIMTAVFERTRDKPCSTSDIILPYKTCRIFEICNVVCPRVERCNQCMNDHDTAIHLCKHSFLTL